MSVHKTNSSTGSGGKDSNDLKNPYTVEDGAAQEPHHLGTTMESAVITDHHAERSLCRKFDYRLLPVLTLMYLFNALDKGNLGNAKTNHLESDLHFRKNDYNIVLSVFYVPYVLFAPPIVSSCSCCFGGVIMLICGRECWGRSTDPRWSCRS